MSGFDLFCEVILRCKLIITDTARILYSKVFGLLMYLETTLLCYLIVTIITHVLDFLMN